MCRQNTKLAYTNTCAEGLCIFALRMASWQLAPGWNWSRAVPSPFLMPLLKATRRPVCLSQEGWAVNGCPSESAPPAHQPGESTRQAPINSTFLYMDTFQKESPLSWGILGESSLLFIPYNVSWNKGCPHKQVCSVLFALKAFAAGSKLKLLSCLTDRSMTSDFRAEAPCAVILSHLWLSVYLVICSHLYLM